MRGDVSRMGGGLVMKGGLMMGGVERVLRGYVERGCF